MRHLQRQPTPLAYRGTSLIRNSNPLGPYSRTMPRALWRPLGEGLFLMSEVHVALYVEVPLLAKTDPIRCNITWIK